jgi:hypothetical protein
MHIDDSSSSEFFEIDWKNVTFQHGSDTRAPPMNQTGRSPNDSPHAGAAAKVSFSVCVFAACLRYERRWSVCVRGAEPSSV